MFQVYLLNKILIILIQCSSINKNLSGISKISSDRLLDEFKKIFRSLSLSKIRNDEYSFDTIKLIFPQFSGLIFFKNLNNFSLNKMLSIKPTGG